MEGETLYYIPVIPMRGMIVFPQMNINFDAGRDMSVKAIDAALGGESLAFLAAQRSADKNDPTADDVYTVGTIVKINQVMRLPGNVMRVVVTGVKRGKIREFTASKPYFKAVIVGTDDFLSCDYRTKEAYLHQLKEAFEEYSANNKRLNADNFMQVMGNDDLGSVCDIISAAVDMKIEEKQGLLEENDTSARAEKLISIINEQTDILKIEQTIARRVKESLDKNQKEYYLREQMKVISEELGDGENVNKEADEYRQKIKDAGMDKDSTEKLMREVDRFVKMPMNSAESSVIRSYLDTVFDMPWMEHTEESFDIGSAEKILNEDHYGLKDVKDRVLEYLAVRHFTDGKNGTILCLVGPPGTGKTSVAKSVARALNRKYVRVSLGGVHDEADIRGHRKTYIGAMEGRIMAAMKEVKVNNPLILLDEVDKMGSDYRGNPSAALLEVLDSEQNNAFRDHYIEVPFDLSRVLFITTANTLETVSRPLIDRMEVIELTGYTEDEKFHIAKEHLIGKALAKNGLTSKQIKISDSAVKKITAHYTREAGVRKLEQTLESICRKAAREILENSGKEIRITGKNLEKFLGHEKYHFDMMNEKDEVGVARGLAWTVVGGETLSIEANVMAGTGKVELTGKLGDVMKESAMAAISYIRSRSDDLNIEKDFYEKKDIHIHVPEGAVPKDGPSAGITMATALVSSLTGKPVRKDVAMTGEITLRGRVLPIGGLKEKSLAAYRAGIKTVIIPKENEQDIDDIPQEIRDKMKFIPVSGMDSVLKNALRAN